ncbi:MAG TPA: ABC transporter permease [Bryobacteraceae bacterium]|nr:ABC transporter permease [Bryobacteraceae bacterium]
MKKVLPAMKIAFRALRINKLRSALTMLGIIIGVGAVIAMVAVGSGATERIQQQIASIGSNVIMVSPGSVTASGIRLGSGFATTLTLDDARTIGRDCPSVQAVAPSSRGGAQIVFGNNNWATSVQGTTPDYLGIRDIQIQSGASFTQQDVDSDGKVALLGQTVVDNLFNGNDPIGQVIRIKHVPFTVMGTLVPKGQSPTGQDQDDIIIVPITTGLKKIFGVNQARANAVGSLIVQARGPQAIQTAQDEMTSVLRQRHHLQQNQDNDFTVRNLEEVFKAQETSSHVMSILLAAIASVSLIVGGIGIMNIMLVSVTERTREIGLRQAVGAKTKDILTQFLVEAVTLSILGGVVGIILGVIASKLISIFAQWSTLVSPAAILMAFVFSALVGVFFGFYPARKAALLDPIDALRYE